VCVGGGGHARSMPCGSCCHLGLATDSSAWQMLALSTAPERLFLLQGPIQQPAQSMVSPAEAPGPKFLETSYPGCPVS